MHTVAGLRDWQLDCAIGSWIARLAAGLHDWQLDCTIGIPLIPITGFIVILIVRIGIAQKVVLFDALQLLFFGLLLVNQQLIIIVIDRTRTKIGIHLLLVECVADRSIDIVCARLIAESVVVVIVTIVATRNRVRIEGSTLGRVGLSFAGWFVVRVRV
jgi:hypothetical protein